MSLLVKIYVNICSVLYNTNIDMTTLCSVSPIFIY